jgi:general secretion pathway protein I
MSSLPKSSGFTLLEILIALAILAILMIGLIKITSDNTRNLWHVENKTIAAIIAANHAAQLRLSNEKKEQEDGWETQGGRRWYWQANRNVTTTLGLWQYQIRVYLEGDKDPYTEISSFIPDTFDPEAFAQAIEKSKDESVDKPAIEPDAPVETPTEEPPAEDVVPEQSYE